MRRSPFEKLQARWVTGPTGHAFAFLLDAVPLVGAWWRWRQAVRRGDLPA